MVEQKRLGKIVRAEFGFGGYDNAMIGLSLTFEMEGSGVSAFKGTWATWSERCKWTLADQAQIFAEVVILLGVP